MLIHYRETVAKTVSLFYLMANDVAVAGVRAGEAHGCKPKREIHPRPPKTFRTVSVREFFGILIVSDIALKLLILAEREGFEPSKGF